MVKTPAFQCRGRGFDPRSGSQESIYHAAQEKGKTKTWRDSEFCCRKERIRMNVTLQTAP